MTPAHKSSATAPRIVRLGLMWMIGAPLIAFFGVAGVLFWIFLPQIGIGQIWVAVAAVLLTVYSVITLKVNQGRARTERLMREGLPGFATLLEAQGTGVMVNRRPQVRLRLRVEVRGRAPYETEIREVLPFLGLESVGRERRVPVFVDRDDPTSLVIDWKGVADAALAPAPAKDDPAGGIAARIETLQGLRRRGLISQSEFEEQRKRIVSDI